LIGDRLAARDADSSLLIVLGTRGGALTRGTCFKALPDTDRKLAGLAFAFEHGEVAI
jgi:hypothetical protein